MAQDYNLVMAYVVMAYIVIAQDYNLVVAYIVMAYIVMAQDHNLDRPTLARQAPALPAGC